MLHREAVTQASPTGVLRLRVRVKADDAAPMRGLARKRFFLIPGTLEQNRALIDAVERQPAPQGIVITRNSAPVPH